jgi:hypothetical protein
MKNSSLKMYRFRFETFMKMTRHGGRWEKCQGLFLAVSIPRILHIGRIHPHNRGSEVAGKPGTGLPHFGDPPHNPFRKPCKRIEYPLSSVYPLYMYSSGIKGSLDFDLTALIQMSVKEIE